MRNKGVYIYCLGKFCNFCKLVRCSHANPASTRRSMDVLWTLGPQVDQDSRGSPHISGNLPMAIGEWRVEDSKILWSSLYYGIGFHPNDALSEMTCKLAQIPYIRYVAVDLSRTSSCLSQSHLLSYWNWAFCHFWDRESTPYMVWINRAIQCKHNLKRNRQDDCQCVHDEVL